LFLFACLRECVRVKLSQQGPTKLTSPLSLKYNPLILETIGSILDELLNSRCCALDPETAVSEASLSYYHVVFGLRQLTGNSGATV